MTCTVSMPEMSSKNQPQLVYMSCAWRCISMSSRARTRSCVGERVAGVQVEEVLSGRLAAVKDDADVAVAGGPDILEELGAVLLGERSEGVAQLVESLAQRGAPLLIEAGLAAVAAAVGAPALDAVDAAP